MSISSQTRGVSPSSMIITLERLLEEANDRLYEEQQSKKVLEQRVALLEERLKMIHASSVV